jgi:hypothetical protein
MRNFVTEAKEGNEGNWERPGCFPTFNLRSLRFLLSKNFDVWPNLPVLVVRHLGAVINRAAELTV